MSACDIHSRLGVLITYHNEGPLLTECLCSLMQNSDQPEETWIYDDASYIRPDEYIPNGLNVTLVRSDVPRGPAHGRNALLQRCASDYVHFQDADDLFAVGWCAAVRHCIRRHKPDVVFTEGAYFRNGSLISIEFAHLRELSGAGDLVRFSINPGVATSTGTYLRQRVEEVGGYDERLRMAEDYEFNIRFTSIRPHYRLIFEPLLKYRLRAGSLSSDARASYMAKAECLMRLRNSLPAEYQEDISEALAAVGSHLYRHGLPEKDARRDAVRVFAASREGAKPRYKTYRRPYRVVATLMGQSFAERCRQCFLAAASRTERGVRPAREIG